MLLLGIPTRRPSFDELTAASVMAIGLWLLTAALLWRFGESPSRFDAGAALVVIWWGSVAACLGVRPNRGARHLMVNVAVSALLLGGYSLAWFALA